MLGIIRRIGEIAKIIENTMVFNDFSRFGGSKSASFSIGFQSVCRVSGPRSFFCRLGVAFGVDLGAVWASQTNQKRNPFWNPLILKKLKPVLARNGKRVFTEGILPKNMERGVPPRTFGNSLKRTISKSWLGGGRDSVFNRFEHHFED